jgi:hypothetical protein
MRPGSLSDKVECSCSFLAFLEGSFVDSDLRGQRMAMSNDLIRYVTKTKGERLEARVGIGFGPCPIDL